MNRKLGYDISADAAGTFMSMDQVISNPGSSVLPRLYGKFHIYSVVTFMFKICNVLCRPDLFILM